MRSCQLIVKIISAAAGLYSPVLGLGQGYADLILPVVIIAGDGDRVVFKRRSSRRRDSIPGSVPRIVADAGHMVHHRVPRQVVKAVESVVEATALGTLN